MCSKQFSSHQNHWNIFAENPFKGWDGGRGSYPLDNFSMDVMVIMDGLAVLNLTGAPWLASSTYWKGVILAGRRKNEESYYSSSQQYVVKRRSKPPLRILRVPFPFLRVQRVNFQV